MPIIPLDPLVVAAGAGKRAYAFTAAFNISFDVIVSFAVYLLPAVAAIRLVQRS